VDEWGAALDKFNPDRFKTAGPQGKIPCIFLMIIKIVHNGALRCVTSRRLCGCGTGKPITREAPSKGYLPFSFGKHSCIGGMLALVEGTIILSLLAQRFTFHEVRECDLEGVSHRRPLKY
jgi:cytochrome P450